MKRLLAALLIATLPVCGNAFAANPEKAAEEAVRNQLSAATIWIDATWGFRNKGAANDLNMAHKAFYARGYHVVSVEPYVENGDLQGFFVTYEKK